MTEAALPRPTVAIRPLDAAVVLGAAAFASIVVFALSIAGGVAGYDLSMVAVALLTLMVGIIPAALDRARPPERRQIFLTAFSLVYLAYFVVPILPDYFWWEGIDDSNMRLINIAPPDIVRGQVAALVGLLATLAGFAIPIGRSVARAIPLGGREWPHHVALGVALFMIPVGWVLFLAGQARVIPTWLGTGLLGTLASSLFFGFALLTATYLRYRSRPALGLMILLLPPTMAIGFLTGSKKTFLASLAMIVLTNLVVTRRIRARWIAAGVLTIATVYPVAQFYREFVLLAGGGHKLTVVEVLSDPARTAQQLSLFLNTVEGRDYLGAGFEATAKRLNALGILAVIVRDTGTIVPFQGGWSIGYVFISFIPRFVWPGKPITTIGRWVTDHYTNSPGAVSSTGCSWIGELYFNFGWTGIVVGMFVVGLYFRILQETVFRPGATIPMVIGAVAVLWATLQTLEAQLTAPFNGVAFHFVPIVATHFALTLFGATVPTRDVRPAPAAAP